MKGVKRFLELEFWKIDKNKKNGVRYSEWALFLERNPYIGDVAKIIFLWNSKR